MDRVTRGRLFLADDVHRGARLEQVLDNLQVLDLERLAQVGEALDLNDDDLRVALVDDVRGHRVAVERHLGGALYFRQRERADQPRLVAAVVLANLPDHVGVGQAASGDHPTSGHFRRQHDAWRT